MVKHKIIIPIITTIISLCAINDSASALTYSDNVNMQFTFNPTISINISGDLTIDDLVPGSYSDSNIITVTTATNNVTGYTLTSNVGNSNHNYTDLRLDSSNTTNVFSNLTTNKATLDTFPSDTNTWGYSYSVDNGTNWISGDYDSNSNNPTNGYNGLPLYSSLSPTTSGIKLAETNTNTTSTILFKIGARSTNNQVAGTYTNVINFYATANNTPTTFYDAFASEATKPGSAITQHNGYYKMQDMNSDICSAVDIGSVASLIDIRDNHVYLVGKAKDNNCWMIQNLRLGRYSDSLVLDNTTSNVDASGFTLDGKSPDGKFTAMTVNVDGVDVPNQNNNSQYYCTDDYGCYYNWYTATAGSGTTSVASGSVDYSICPAGWTLPTGGPGGQFQTLYSHYNSPVLMLVDDPTTTKENTTGKTPGFLFGGSCSAGGQQALGNGGRYWSRTAYDAQLTQYLSVYASVIYSADNYYKYYGFSVRCLAR